MTVLIEKMVYDEEVQQIHSYENVDTITYNDQLDMIRIMTIDGDAVYVARSVIDTIRVVDCDGDPNIPNLAL